MGWVAGGYFLTKRGPYEKASGPAPRGRYVTLSQDQIDFFPDAWALSWVDTSDEERARAAIALDIPVEALASLVPSVSALFDERAFGWPNVLPSVAAARRFAQLAASSTPWLLIGFAIDTADLDRVLRQNAPPPQQPGYAPVGPGGVYTVLRNRASLDPGYVELGFDVLHLDAGQVMEANLDVDLRAAGAYQGTLNDDGLLPDFASARAAAVVLTDNPALGTPRAFVPAQIVGYAA